MPTSMPVFRGGVLRKYNRAVLRTRRSEGRSVDVYYEHCGDVIENWEHAVGKDGERKLRPVWVLGALTTAVEAGFERPAAGNEISWLKQHKSEFQKLTDEGNEDFVGLVNEIESRDDFAGVREGDTKTRKNEE